LLPPWSQATLEDKESSVLANRAFSFLGSGRERSALLENPLLITDGRDDSPRGRELIIHGRYRSDLIRIICSHRSRQLIIRGRDRIVRDPLRSDLPSIIEAGSEP
jgi:hypothetical protein